MRHGFPAGRSPFPRHRGKHSMLLDVCVAVLSVAHQLSPRYLNGTSMSSMSPPGLAIEVTVPQGSILTLRYRGYVSRARLVTSLGNSPWLDIILGPLPPTANSCPPPLATPSVLLHLELFCIFDLTVGIPSSGHLLSTDSHHTALPVPSPLDGHANFHTPNLRSGAVLHPNLSYTSPADRNQAHESTYDTTGISHRSHDLGLGLNQSGKRIDDKVSDLQISSPCQTTETHHHPGRPRARPAPCRPLRHHHQRPRRQRHQRSGDR